MRNYLLLPLLLVGSLTGCAVYGDSYGRSGYERPYYPRYEVQRHPVYVEPRHSSRYRDARREDYYRQPPRYVAPPAHYYRPPVQQGWSFTRDESRSWSHSRDPRNFQRPPPPRRDDRRSESRGWETRR
jgi:hypothetical protein